MPKDKKIFILDTNVLIHDPKAMFSFDGAHVGIPATVLEELDQFKGEGTERGRNSRQTIRSLDELRERGSLRDGVKLEDGGILQILFYDDTKLEKTPLVRSATQDNEILLTALAMKQEGYDVIFISKDLNARVKADAIGIASEDYSKETVTEKEFYQGWVQISVPAVELKKEFPPQLIGLAKDKIIIPNEFVLVESNNNPHNYRVFKYLGNEKFKAIFNPTLSWPLAARNPQQLMAMELLLDSNIQFACLFGPAGTGKTFLALLAGLHSLFVNKNYDRMIISRPVVPLGRDIGFLPGTVAEKLQSWMMPIYDNMQYIMHTINKSNKFQDNEEEEVTHKKHNHNHKGKHKHKRHHGVTFEDLIHQGKISLEAITYMRGRTIPYQLILIDEAQNLTPHEIKTLVTRVGEGSKIILTGDPYQIDSPYLDFASNGLVVASERFKGQSVFGSVFLPVSERSELSRLAGELL
ncbi:MAG TPA: PhoH family protein [Candidatus Babeliales bacterium]|jgi:PhoH-like ATPase|nr:PhoH family protein [Candidatus Babeliales bacterium]